MIRITVEDLSDYARDGRRFLNIEGTKELKTTSHAVIIFSVQSQRENEPPQCGANQH